MKRTAATSGGEFCGPCPFCGGRDRFRAWPRHPSGRERWWCRQCQRSGDTIDLLRTINGLSFASAVAAIGGNPLNIPTQMPQRTVRSVVTPPNGAWQGRAEGIATEAERALQDPGGARALAYLRSRGFTDETIQGARLGYVAADRRESAELWGLAADHRDVWIPQGISIPWHACGALWKLQIRRPTGSPKYCGPAGSSNALYGVDGLRNDLPCIIVEGEFDALAIAQTAHDLVSAVATGSTHGARLRQWRERLLARPATLVAYDSDEPGERAAAWWLDALPHARRLKPVTDPAAMLEHGADLRTWISEALCTG